MKSIIRPKMSRYLNAQKKPRKYLQITFIIKQGFFFATVHLIYLAPLTYNCVKNMKNSIPRQLGIVVDSARKINWWGVQSLSQMSQYHVAKTGIEGHL
jgi:hypothetical protein